MPQTLLETSSFEPTGSLVWHLRTRAQREPSGTLIFGTQQLEDARHVRNYSIPDGTVLRSPATQRLKNLTELKAGETMCDEPRSHFVAPRQYSSNSHDKRHTLFWCSSTA